VSEQFQNHTVSEQFQNHSVGAVPKSNLQIVQTESEVSVYIPKSGGLTIE